MQVHAGMQFREDVILHGHMSRNELSRLMGGAFGLVYVSFFEGFGIPIVEAMNCEVPVITSNVSSMPEVAGDAALFVDPHSVGDIASKMITLSQNAALRVQLIDEGKVQRQKFSWQQTADRLWKCMMTAMDVR